MDIFWSVVFPPIGVALSKRATLGLVLLNLLLTLCGIIPGIVHALAITIDGRAEDRTDRLIRGLGGRVESPPEYVSDGEYIDQYRTLGQEDNPFQGMKPDEPADPFQRFLNNLPADE